MTTIEKKFLTAPVLVVDDHAMTRDMVRSILKGIGFTNIETAENGHLAYKMLDLYKFRLIICDWNMPGGSGIDFLRNVRGNTQHKDIPFLMLTAEAYRESVEEALKHGVSDYVAKPFTAEILSKKIEAVLKGK